MVQPLVVGNWKMNGSAELAQSLVSATLAHLKEYTPSVRVAVCPPNVYLASVVAQAKPQAALLGVGAQDCHAKASGAFTGDVSVGMLLDVGVQYVIVGHCERRQYHHETDADVAEKAAAARAAGIMPIICVGETLDEQERSRTIEVVERQVLAAVPQGVQGEVVIAYEPVWAIGTGKVPTLQDIEMVHGAIIGCLKQERAIDADRVTVLYGGSVKAANAFEIAQVAGVGGMLVGGASLVAREFCDIVDAVSKAQA